MNTFTKMLIAGSAPALVTTALAAADFPAPATRPEAQSTTQPAPMIAQSNEPLVIPDGTSLQNPGPTSVNTIPNQMLQLNHQQLQQAQQGQPMFVFGLRG